MRKVEATISVDRANLMQTDAASLIKDASLNDRVELRVLGDVGAKIRVINIDSPGVEVINLKISLNLGLIFMPSLIYEAAACLLVCLSQTLHFGRANVRCLPLSSLVSREGDVSVFLCFAYLPS